MFIVKCGYCGYEIYRFPEESSAKFSMIINILRNLGFRCPRCLSLLNLNVKPRIQIRA